MDDVLAHLAVLQFAHQGLAGQRDLVHAVQPVHDHGPIGAERQHGMCDRLDPFRREHAHHLALHPGRIGQRT